MNAQFADLSVRFVTARKNVPTETKKLKVSAKEPFQMIQDFLFYDQDEP